MDKTAGTIFLYNKQEKKITYNRQHKFDFECISKRSIHEQSHDALLGHLSGPYVLIAPPSRDPWAEESHAQPNSKRFLVHHQKESQKESISFHLVFPHFATLTEQKQNPNQRICKNTGESRQTHHRIVLCVPAHVRAAK